MSSTQLDKHIMWWVSSWLTGQAQSIIVNRITSNCQPVTSGVPQGSILGPVLFNIFINVFNAGLEGIPSKFDDDAKLGGAVDSLKGREALQRDLGKLEDWTITSHMKINKGKCQILHLELGNPGCLYRLENEMMESSSMERHLGVLVDGKWNMSQQCSLETRRTNCDLGASGKASPAGQGRGLSRSVPPWCGLTLNIVCSFGHHNIRRI
ncbi:rna-directed dna polymerase from mobile element jockey-like [Pitangus sulphuratus]|nr:rna-directed dna polymerase from mobile element jockey-like [Pitangus sulphuratus]